MASSLLATPPGDSKRNNVIKPLREHIKHELFLSVQDTHCQEKKRWAPSGPYAELEEEGCWACDWPVHSNPSAFHVWWLYRLIFCNYYGVETRQTIFFSIQTSTEKFYISETCLRYILLFHIIAQMSKAAIIIKNGVQDASRVIIIPNK